MKKFYTYAFLREDGKPYYVGKGSGNRLYDKRRKGVKTPTDKTRIIKLKENLTEAEAFRHEVYLIAVLGKKKEGGLLYNISDGGEGSSGSFHSEETRQLMSEKRREATTEKTRRLISESRTGKNWSEEVKQKISVANKGKRGEVSPEGLERIREAQKRRWQRYYENKQK